jgi:hypothetical protein
MRLHVYTYKIIFVVFVVQLGIPLSYVHNVSGSGRFAECTLTKNYFRTGKDFKEDKITGLTNNIYMNYVKTLPKMVSRTQISDVSIEGLESTRLRAQKDKLSMPIRPFSETRFESTEVTRRITRSSVNLGEMTSADKSREYSSDYNYKPKSKTPTSDCTLL